MKISIRLVGGIVGGVLLLSAFGAYAFTGQELAGKAKISIAQARALPIRNIRPFFWIWACPN